MGDRANIEMIYNDGNKVYFYTHWGGYNLPEILKSAMIRGENRWNDEPYLARIIFSEMIKDNILDETGYGISTYICDNEHPIISVNCFKQIISIGNVVEWSFEDFIKTNIFNF